MKLLKNPILILILYSTTSFSSEVIQTGRPGESFGSDIVASDFFQVQTGAALNDLGGSDTITLNNVVRKEVNQNMELRAVVDYADSDLRGSGISSTQIGLRSKLIGEADGLIPQLALQAHLNHNFVSSHFKSNNKGFTSYILMTHSLAEDFSLTHNVGINFSGDSSESTFLWTSSLAKSLNDKWGWYYEFYGNRVNDTNTSFGQTGFDYLINSDVKLDLSYAKRLFDSTDEDLISFGVSARFSTN